MKHLLEGEDMLAFTSHNPRTYSYVGLIDFAVRIFYYRLMLLPGVELTSVGLHRPNVRPLLRNSTGWATDTLAGLSNRGF